MRTLRFKDEPMPGETFINGLDERVLTFKSQGGCDGCVYDGSTSCGVSPRCNGGIFVATPPRLPRVLIVVRGGVADYVADEGVDVVIYDVDNAQADPEGTAPVPAHFADLAGPINVPYEEVKK